jgi:hypothetical protein
MSKFKFEVNPTTGLPQARFQAKLVSQLGETTLQNSNGKNYKVVTVEFENDRNQVQRAAAAIYEGNYSKGVEVGKTYLTTVTINEGKAYLQMSHLENAPMAAAADFGFEPGEIGVAAPSGATSDVKI